MVLGLVSLTGCAITFAKETKMNELPHKQVQCGDPSLRPYIERILEQIKKGYSTEEMTGRRLVAVTFSLGPDGTRLRRTLVSSSGNATLDHDCMNAVDNA